MRCSPPGSRTGNNGFQSSSSLSSQTPHPGNTVTYSITFARRHAHPTAGLVPHTILQLGVPYLFACTNSVACTINGDDAISSGNGQWIFDSESESYIAFNDYDDPSSQWTFTVVFTLHASNTTCSGHVSHVAGGSIGESWPITISTLELDEDERNKRNKKTKRPEVSRVCVDGVWVLSYTSPNADQVPASLGWGWTMGFNKLVVEDAGNDDIIFYDGSGSFERWEKMIDGSYVARYADNYATLTKDGSAPVVITLKDKTELTFRTTDGKISTEVDRNGNTITYHYDVTSGLLTSVDDGEGRATYFGYGVRTDGQPVSIRRQNASAGRLTALEYDENDRLWKVTDAGVDVTEFLYNGDGLLWKKIDPRHQEVEFTYDSGKVVTTTYYGELLTTNSYDTGPNDTKITTMIEEDLTLDPDPAPRTTVLTFDLYSNLIEQIDPLGNVWSYRYQDLTNPYLLTEQIDPNGFSTVYEYEDGNLTSVTDAMGNTTTMTYTDGYLLASIQRPIVTVDGDPVAYDPTLIEYDNGNIKSITDTLEGNPVVTEFTVFGDGRIESVTNRLGQVTTFAYTTQSGGLNAGNLSQISMPDGPNSAPERQVLFTYNAYDERIQVADPAGNLLKMDFDNKSRVTRVTDSLNKETNYHYTQGLLDYIDLPANQGSSSSARRTRFTHDDPGRVLQILSKVSETQEEMRVRHEYDGRSNLKKLIRLKRDLTNTPVEKAYQFSHDVLNRQNQALDPLSGLATVQYDPFCKNLTTCSARGIETKISRDSLCRLTEVVTSDEKRVLEYDELSRLIKVTQTHNPAARYVDPNNLPTDHPPARFGQARYGGGEVSESTEYLYDEWDRLAKITFPDNKTILYEFDLENRVTKVTDMLSHVTEYSYYNDGRLYQVTAKASAGDQVFTYRYDLAGRPYEIQYPGASGIVAMFYDASNNSGWDANGRLTYLRYLKSGNLLQSFQYGYDDSGNRISLIDTPSSGPAITWAYHYDWLDRLTSVYKDTVQQSIYAYDESDNRLELQLPGASQTHTYQYDFADRILSRSVNGTPSETFTHDSDGNMIARVAGGLTTHYTWDSSDKLTSIQKSSFQQTYRYDSQGIRKSKGADTRYFSSGAASLADLLPTNSISYIQGHQILGLLQGGNYYWYIPDGLGSVRLVVDASGAVASTYSSDEFGGQTAVTGSADLRQHTYTGGLGVRNEVGSDSQLLYARQRWYDPGLGRWLNQDPIGFSGGLNLFTYVGNNPTTLVDPSGLETSVLVTGDVAGSMTSIRGTSVDLYRAEVYSNGLYMGQFNVSRAPYDAHTPVSRYGTYGEVPPGSYYLNKRPEDERIEVSDNFGGRTIDGPEGGRDCIQIHPGINAEGCLTCKNSSKSAWNDRQENDDYWRLRDTIIGDVEKGRAQVFILGRHPSDEGASGVARDTLLFNQYQVSRAVSPGPGPWGPRQSRLRQ